MPLTACVLMPLPIGPDFADEPRVLETFDHDAVHGGGRKSYAFRLVVFVDSS
jgi:hypothetical protein